MDMKERTKGFLGLEIATLSFMYRGKWEHSEVIQVFEVQDKGYTYNTHYYNILTLQYPIFINMCNKRYAIFLSLLQATYATRVTVLSARG